MDITRFDEEIQALHRRHQEYLQSSDPRTFRLLRQMLRRARELGDPELIGYVYHSLAFAELFIAGHYGAFLKNLKLSARYLLRCEDLSEMTRVYYLIGVDAMNKGMHDVAHHYYLTARNIAEETGNTTSVAILDECLGHILLLLREYRQSRSFAKRALRGIRKNREHPHYYNNMISGYLNDGIACLGLGKVREARQAYEKTAAFMKQEPEGWHADTHLDFALFGTHLAIAEKDRKKQEEGLAEVIELLGQVPQVTLYMDEISKMCHTWIARGEHRFVGRILKALQKNPIAQDATNAQRMLIDLRADYYAATGRLRELAACYAEQDLVYARLFAEQKQIYRYAQELVELTNELRRERDAANAEHDELILRARTDMLTGIANRYAGNMWLEESFERARERGERLGIVFLDLDDLKAYNDSYGHAAGDLLLVEMGERLSEVSAAEGFFAARFGGDEFVMIFENAEDCFIDSCIEQIRLGSEVQFSSGSYNAIPTEKDKSWEYLVRADQAMYRAKRKKKQRGEESPSEDKER